MSHVLLLINEEAHFRELLRVADLLLDKTTLQPVAFVEDRMKHVGKSSLFIERGIEVLTSDGFSETGGHSTVSPRRTFRWALANFLIKVYEAGRNPNITLRKWDMLAAIVLVRMGPYVPASIGKTIESILNIDKDGFIGLNRRSMLHRAAVCESVLKQRPYVAVVMSEDNIELDTAVWIAVARRYKIKSIVVPYTISNAIEFAESYVGFAPYQIGANDHNRLVSHLFPAWVLRYKGRQFLRTDFAKIVAVESLGLTPPQPWVLNSGYADAIAVESAAMYDYYRAAGIPARQLVNTGSLPDDVIAGALIEVPLRRRSIVQEFGLQDDKPLLLCALPPDQNTFDRPGCEFTSFDDLLEFWSDCLKTITGWNIIVRPHPKTAPERLDSLRQRGLPVSYADTAALVPLCDLYVASVSATIRWAISSAKPVINYDVYQYGYEDFNALRGVSLVKTRAEFCERLLHVTCNEGERAALAAAQKVAAPRWGRLDGLSGRRLLSLLRAEAFEPQMSRHPERTSVPKRHD
jgi:hypothetical protein